MARRQSSPVFIGRRPELDRLERALAAAASHESQVVLVAGDAGVGKTRLVSELVARARASGAQVLSGGCVPVGDAGLPFAAVTEALRGGIRMLGRPGFEALAGPGRGELARLVPNLAPGPLTAQPPTGGWEQTRLFELLLGFLGRLTAKASVVLVIEDLHWADEATRDLVAYLARNLVEERLLLLATVRSDDLHRRHPLMPLLAELERSTRVDRIDLAPFDRDELADQLAGILGREPEPSLVAEIGERSEGNAYLVEELAAVGPTARLPDTVEDVLLARVGRLSEPARDLLRVASAAGPRIDLDVLATVASGIVGNSSAAMREVVDEHVLVRRDGDETAERYAFRHALLQEAVYGQLLPAERARYHEGFARALSGRPGPLDPFNAAELAHHWEGARDTPRALEASIAAGRAAAGIYAFGDAQRLFEQALALWDRVPDARDRAGMDQPALLELAGVTAFAAGAYVRAALHLRAATALVDAEGDPVRRGLLLVRLGRYAFRAGEPAEWLPAVREAVRLVPCDPPTAACARVLGGLARSLMYLGTAEEATRVAREAITAAAATGTRDVEAEALSTLSLIRGEVDDLQTTLVALRRARDLALEIDDDATVLRVWWDLLYHLDAAADLDTCSMEAAAANAWLVERGRIRSGAMLLVVQAFALHQLGRWDEEDSILHSLRLATPETSDAFQMADAVTELAIGRGDLDVAARTLATLRDVARRRLARPEFARSEFQWPVIVIADLGGRLALATGDLAEGRRLVESGLSALRDQVPRDAGIGSYVLLSALRVESELAERARLRGKGTDLEDAAAHGTEIIEEARSVVAAIIAGAPTLGRRPAAVLALCEAEWSRIRGLSDPALWAAAAGACEAALQLHLRPYARYRQAEALLAEKADRTEVAAVLREAHASVVAMGARPLQRDIEALAERARLRLDLSAQAAGDVGHGTAAERMGLTPRELEVLSLVTAGRTNRQIAAELFISEKTAGVHVSNILGKLGASGRTEAAAIAHRLGLVG
jgi:DNA-binding NarL/FixJ family response regulator